MRKIPVDLGARSYEILILTGLLREVAQVFQEYRIRKRLFVLTNERVHDLFGSELVSRLSAGSFEATEILIPDGEVHKTMETVERIYTYLIAQGADRHSAIVALGGGVTGDIAGFVAATFMRGIAYIQVPTTLLAQVDSSVGGKTGVNHRLGKNLIGAFHQPSLVCVDPGTLGSLDPREFRSGLYEVVKYGLISDTAFFDQVERCLDKPLQHETMVLEGLIARCCEIKAEITSADETEQDRRRILNFGHTFGHALEMVTGYRLLTHGEAIAYGMLAAVKLSAALGLLEPESLERIERCILRVGFLPSVEGCPASALLEGIRRDKKRRDDRAEFVLLKRIGEATVIPDLQRDLLVQVWDEVRRCAYAG